MSFGTGAVKMTPAHDPNDYEVGMRHKLDFINILNDDGTLNANAGPEFEGLKRFHARRKVVEEMKKKGLYVGDAENPMSIPVCAKSGDFIESVMKPQWWVSCKTLADKAIEVRIEHAASAPRTARLTGPIIAAHPGWRAQDPPADVRVRVVPVARGHPGLVHLASAVVGSPCSGLLCQDRRRGAGRALRNPYPLASRISPLT